MKIFIAALFLTSCGLEPLSPVDKENDSGVSAVEVGSLSITPGAISFGQSLIGSPQTEFLTFANASASSISISSVYLEGNDSFSLDSSLLSFDLDAETEEIISVHFNPDSIGLLDAQLNILVENESAIGQVQISGEGVTSIEEDTGDDTGDSTGNTGLLLSKDTHNFGNIGLNSTATLAIDVTNESSEDLAINSIISSNAAFEVSSFSTLQQGAVLTAGFTRTLNIGFTPIQETSYSGTMTISTSNGQQATVSLTGAGTCTNCFPILSINTGGDAPDVMNQFNLFWTSLFPLPATETFTISNQGAEALEIQSITITNDMGAPSGLYCNEAGEFSLPGASSFTVPPNGSSNVQVNLEYVGGLSSGTSLCGENDNYYLFNPSDIQNTIQILSNDPAVPISTFRLGGTITVLQ